MGASGDMLLGALLGAGWAEPALRHLISELGVPVRLAVLGASRRGVPAVRVEIEEEDPPHSRTYPMLARLLAESRIDEGLRRDAAAALHRLGSVEAKAHSMPIEEVHLHELGGLDTLVDLVGVLAGVRALGLDCLTASPVNLGRGWVHTRHGHVPVPAPATAALVEGMPVYAGEGEAELLTPTGAVLLATLVSGWGALPPMRLQRVGTGAGKADLPRANVLRLFVGEAWDGSFAPTPVEGTREAGPVAARTERLVMLETSIDDLNPQIYPHLTSRLLAAGALDVMIVPAVMKKGRPGHLLRVLAAPEHARTLGGIVLAETTTLGVRQYDVTRIALGRRLVDVQTAFGPVPVKIAEDESGVLSISPEFEPCRALAERHGVPVKRVIAAAQHAAAALGEPP
jgi:uncharacterized protein (TIGR00299 family) protein